MVRGPFLRLSLLAVGLLLAMTTHAADSARLQAAKEFTKLGYGDLFNLPFRSLNFRTEELTTVEAQAVIRLVERYNAFEGRKIADALARFRGRVSSYEFGREGSPVLYINLPYWTHQREGVNTSARGERIGEEDHKRFLEELRKTFVNGLAADEFQTDEVRTRTVRIWWD